MRKFLWLSMMVVVCMAHGSASLAATGGELETLCQSNDGDKQLVCAAYIAGAIDGIRSTYFMQLKMSKTQTGTDTKMPPKRLYCWESPLKLTPEQLVKEINNYSENNSGFLDIPAAFSVFGVYMEALCPKKPN